MAVSLLPRGITKVIAHFKKDDLIKITDEQGNLIGVGKANYSSDKIESEKLIKKQNPTVHYDYLYMENRD
jgi:glutamate 5-kinase